mgnify:CR=1 FL=1
MSLEVEEKLDKIPIINWFVKLLKKLRLPGFEGLSVYDLLEMYVLGILNGTLSTRASAIAFSLFMALFPLLIFMVTLIPFLVSYISIEHGDFDVQFRLFLESFLPSATGDYFGEVFQQIKDQKRGGLLSSSFILSIFLIANGVNAIFSGFEYSYHIKEMRSVLKQYFISMGMAILLSLILLLTVAVAVYFEIGIGDLKQRGWLEDDLFWIETGRFLLFVLLIFVSVSLLYKFGTKEVKHRSFFTPGSILTTILTIVMFRLFSIYVLKFATYNELYGSIGTLLVLMLFVWINSIILLLGFELNASISRLKRFTFKKRIK